MSNALERSVKTPSVYSPFLKELVIWRVEVWRVQLSYFFENQTVFHKEGLYNLDDYKLYCTLFFLKLSKIQEG